jgi:hypothetical protein
MGGWIPPTSAGIPAVRMTAGDMSVNSSNPNWWESVYSPAAGTGYSGRIRQLQAAKAQAQAQAAQQAYQQQVLQQSQQPQAQAVQPAQGLQMPAQFKWGDVGPLNSAQPKQTGGWANPYASFAGQMERATDTAKKDIAADPVGGTIRNTAAGAFVDSIRAAMERPSLETIANVPFAFLGAAAIPFAPKQVFPYLNLPTQAIEAAFNTGVNQQSGSAAGPAERYTAFKKALDDGKPVGEAKKELNPYAGASLEDDARALQVAMGGDYSAKYRSDYIKNRKLFGVIPMPQFIGEIEAAITGMNDPAKFAVQMSANITGTEQRKDFIARVLAGENPYSVMNGLPMPADDADEADVSSFMQSFEEYKTAAGRAKRAMVLRNGGTLRVAEQAARDAEAEAGAKVNADGMIPASLDPVMELVVQTSIGFSKLDLMNFVPLGKVFGLGVVKKLPVVGRVARSIEGAMPSKAASDKANWLDEVYDAEASNVAGETMAERVEAARRGMSVEMMRKQDQARAGVAPVKPAPAAAGAPAVDPAQPVAAAVAGAPAAAVESTAFKLGKQVRDYAAEKAAGVKNTNGLLARAYLSIADGREYLPQTKAHVQDGHALNIISTLAMDAKDGNDVIARLSKFVFNPEELTAQFGNAPVSVRAEFARPVVEKMLEAIPEMDSIREGRNGNPFNFAKFLAESSHITARASREINDVVPMADRPAVERFSAGVKGWLGEFWFRNPGYIFRNAMSDFSIMAMDGLASRDGYDDLLKYMERFEIRPQDIVGGKFGLEGEQVGNASKLSAIPLVGAWQNKWGDVNTRLETGRRVRAFYTGFKKMWAVNWQPRVDPRVRAAMGDRMGGMLDQLEGAFKMGANPKEIRDSYNRIMYPKTAMDSFNPLSYMDAAGVSRDALSPRQMVELQRDLSDVARAGGDDAAVQSVIDKHVARVEEARQKAIHAMGDVFQPRQDSEATAVRDVQEAVTLESQMAKRLVDAGLMTQEAALKTANEFLHEIVDGEIKVRTARDTLLQAVHNLKADDIPQMVSLLRHLSDVEATARRDYRIEQDKLIQETNGRIAELFDGKGNKDAKAQMAMAEWDKYHSLNRSNAAAMNKAVLDAFKWGADAGSRLSSKAATWDALKAERAGLDSYLTTNENVLADLRKLMDEEGRAEFDRQLAGNRFRIDLARNDGWRQVSLIARAEPKLATDLMDVMLSVEKTVQDNAIVAAMESRVLLSQMRAGQITRPEYAKLNDENWQKHFDFAEHVYGEQTNARLAAAQVRHSEMAEGLRRMEIPDDEIFRLFANLDTPEGQQAMRAALTRVQPMKLSPLEGRPEGEIPTRTAVEDQIRTFFTGISDDQVQAQMAQWDALAGAWAAAYGRPVDDWYATRFAAIVGGVEPGNDVLMQTVWHGSPHKFEQFDIGKIGAGEGNQTYGWGLYFAENIEVAKAYREKLATRTRAHNTLDGTRATEAVIKKAVQQARANGDEHLADMLYSMRKELMSSRPNLNAEIAARINDEKAVIQNLEQRLADHLEKKKQPGYQSTWTEEDYTVRIKAAQGRIDALDKIYDRFTFVESKINGAIYKVDIPENDYYLVWEKPLSEQPAGVRDIARKLVQADPEWRQGDGRTEYTWGGRVLGYVDGQDGAYEIAYADYDKSRKVEPIMRTSQRYSTLEEARAELVKKIEATGRPMGDNMTGQDVYHELAKRLSSAYYPDPIEASAALNQAGIPGLRYMDQWSRTAEGEGTYNYVLFDDRPAKVTEVLYQRLHPWANLKENPKLRAELEAGKTLQQAQAEGVARGAVEFMDDDRAILYALQAPDISTLTHETGHILRRQLSQMGDDFGGQYAQDYEVAADWAGAKFDDASGKYTWTTEAEEKFARGWEEYWMEGKAPTPGLQAVFDRFKVWLSNIYAKVRHLVEGNLTDEMRGVFDRMLTEQIKQESPPASVEEFAQRRNIAGKPTLADVQTLLDEARNSQAEIMRRIDNDQVRALEEAAALMPSPAEVHKFIKPDGSARGQWLEKGEVPDWGEKLELYPALRGRFEGVTGGEAQVWQDYLREAQQVHRQLKSIRAEGKRKYARTAAAMHDAAEGWQSIINGLSSQADVLMRAGDLPARELARQMLAHAGGDVDNAIALLDPVLDWDNNPDYAASVFDALEELTTAPHMAAVADQARIKAEAETMPAESVVRPEVAQRQAEDTQVAARFDELSAKAIADYEPGRVDSLTPEQQVREMLLVTREVENANTAFKAITKAARDRGEPIAKEQWRTHPETKDAVERIRKAKQIQNEMQARLGISPDARLDKWIKPDGGLTPAQWFKNGEFDPAMLEDLSGWLGQHKWNDAAAAESPALPAQQAQGEAQSQALVGLPQRDAQEPDFEPFTIKRPEPAQVSPGGPAAPSWAGWPMRQQDKPVLALPAPKPVELPTGEVLPVEALTDRIDLFGNVIEELKDVAKSGAKPGQKKAAATAAAKLETEQATLQASLDDWVKIEPEAAQALAAQQETIAAEAAKPAIAGGAVSGATWKLNDAKGGVEIKFAGRPDDSVKDRIKAAGFRWSSQQGLWYAKQSPARIALAKALAGDGELAAKPAAEADTSPIAVKVDELGAKVDTLLAAVTGKPADVAAPAAPAFKVGDRVEYVNAAGRLLTGKIRSVSSDGTANVNVDQIALAGGVPIGRIEVVNLNQLRPEQPVAFNPNDTIEPADLVDAPKTPRDQVGDLIKAHDAGDVSTEEAQSAIQNIGNEPITKGLRLFRTERGHDIHFTEARIKRVKANKYKVSLYGPTAERPDGFVELYELPDSYGQKTATEKAQSLNTKTLLVKADEMTPSDLVDSETLRTAGYVDVMKQWAGAEWDNVRAPNELQKMINDLRMLQTTLTRKKNAVGGRMSAGELAAVETSARQKYTQIQDWIRDNPYRGEPASVPPSVAAAQAGTIAVGQQVQYLGRDGQWHTGQVLFATKGPQGVRYSINSLDEFESPGGMRKTVGAMEEYVRLAPDSSNETVMPAARPAAAAQGDVPYIPDQSELPSEPTGRPVLYKWDDGKRLSLRFPSWPGESWKVALREAGFSETSGKQWYGDNTPERARFVLDLVNQYRNFGPGHYDYVKPGAATGAASGNDVISSPLWEEAAQLILANEYIRKVAQANDFDHFLLGMPKYLEQKLFEGHWEGQEQTIETILANKERYGRLMAEQLYEQLRKPAQTESATRPAGAPEVSDQVTKLVTYLKDAPDRLQPAFMVRSQFGQAAIDEAVKLGLIRSTLNKRGGGEAFEPTLRGLDAVSPKPGIPSRPAEVAPAQPEPARPAAEPAPAGEKQAWAMTEKEWSVASGHQQQESLDAKQTPEIAAYMKLKRRGPGAAVIGDDWGWTTSVSADAMYGTPALAAAAKAALASVGLKAEKIPGFTKNARIAGLREWVVRNALEEGEGVPDAVLAEFPKLRKLAELTAQSAKPAVAQPAGGDLAAFDSAKWNQDRADRIKASKAAGNIHLDAASIDTGLRGLGIYSAHDPKERGIVRTTINSAGDMSSGSVVVDWVDQYSADKNFASPAQEAIGRGKSKTVLRSTLGQSDLKDYVFADKAAALRQAGIRGESARPALDIGDPKPLAPDQTAVVDPGSRVSRLYGIFSDALEKGEPWPTTPKALRDWLKEKMPDFDEKDTATIDEMYDVIEGVNTRSWSSLRDANAPTLERLQKAQEFEDRLANRTRSIEITKRQQFSTPLTIGEGAHTAAMVRADDVVLEPNAGTASLIDGLRGQVKRIIANELDDRRVSVLRSMGGLEVRQGDALRLAMDGVRADVVIMNPPWGKYSTGKYGQAIGGDFTPGDVAERFVAQAMKTLPDGGRLVAVMPMTIKAPSAAAFQKWITDNHTLRAAIQSPPDAYNRRGTTVESILLVIDKGKHAGPKPVIATNPYETGRYRSESEKVGPEYRGPKNWSEYAALLDQIAARPLNAVKAVQSERPITTTSGVESVQPGRAGSEGVAEGGQDSTTVRPGGRRPAGRGRPAGVVSEEQPARGPADEGTKVGMATEGAGQLADAGRPEPIAAAAESISPDGAKSLDADTAKPAEPVAITADIRAKLAADRAAQDEAVKTSTQFVGYKVRSGDAISAHPRAVVETQTLSGVSYPELTYKPHRLVDVIRQKGWISDEQYDVVRAIGQANDAGHAVLIADGVGVGKSREIAGSMIDYLESGKANRILFTTRSADNVEGMIEELQGIAGTKFNEYKIVRVSTFKEAKKQGGEYIPLPREDKAIYLIDSYNFAPYEGALKGVGFDAWYADEAHVYANVDEASRGKAWLDLHANLMAGKAKINYFTATPATQPDDLKYLFGLKEWTTEKAGFADFIARIKGVTERGDDGIMPDVQSAADTAVAALVGNDSEDVKGGGKGSWGKAKKDAFSLSMSLPEMEQVMRELKRKGKYISRELWRGGVEFEVKDLAPTEAQKVEHNNAVMLMRDIDQTWRTYAKANEKGSGFGPRGMLQNEAKRRYFDMRLDSIMSETEAALARGQQVVIYTTSVNGVEEGRGNLAGAINSINKWAIEKDGETGELSDPTEIPEAVEDIMRLQEQLKELKPLRDPLGEFTKRFKKDGVAFIVGDVKSSERQKMMKDFQAGKLKVAVISDAGTIGISLHQNNPNTGRRHLIVGEFQWRADDFQQLLGRVDRSGQLSSPSIQMLTTGSAGERKFVATIANRMKSLGAIAKGQADSAGDVNLSGFELVGGLGRAAMDETWLKLSLEDQSMFMASGFVDKESGMPANMPAEGVKVQQFLLELQLMPLETAKRIEAVFVDEYDNLLRGIQDKSESATGRLKGKVLRSTPISDDLTLHEIINDNGQKQGILEGVLMLPKAGQKRRMPLVLNALVDRGSGDFGGLTATGKVPYMSFFDKENNRYVSGAIIPPGRIEAVAGALGASVKRSHSPESILVDLQAGDKIPLMGSEGQTYTLRMRKDGDIAIDGAKMAHKAQLMGAGAKLDVAGSYWKIPADRMQDFIARFPLADAEGPAGNKLYQRTPYGAFGFVDPRRLPDPKAMGEQDANMEKGLFDGPQTVDMANVVSDEATKALHAVGDGAKAHMKQNPMDMTKTISPEEKKILDAELGRVMKDFYSKRQNTMEQAKELTNFALTDYGLKRGFDSYLSMVAPFSYWYTRQGRNFAIRMMQNPAMLAQVLRWKYWIEKENKKRGVRGRFAGQLRLPLSEVVPGMSDVYVDPLAIIFPMAQWFNTDMNDAGKANTAVQQLMQLGENVGLRPSPILDWPLRFSNMMVSRQPGQEGYAEEMAAYGRPSIGNLLPQTGAIQGLTAAAGIGGPTGVDIESIPRKALGLPEGEQFDNYRISRSISDIAAANNVKEGTIDSRPYLLAQELVSNHPMDLPTVLNTYTPDQLAKELGVQDMMMAAQALQIAREGARTATTQRGFQQLASFFGGIRAQQLPEGEKARWDMRATERAAAYNPMTGYGSREGAQAVQAAYPALQVQRGQYGSLPGDSKDYRYIYDSAQRQTVNRQFDALKDAVIQSRPWDRKAAREIESARWRAQERATREAGMNDSWMSEYQSVIAKLTGQGAPDTQAAQTYRPLSVSGATPKEALDIRRNEAMRFITQTQPLAEDFTNEDGTINFDAYNIAVKQWKNNLPMIAAGIPQVFEILAKADEEGRGGAVRQYLDSLNGAAVDEYRRRNDTALEAVQRAYFERMYQPALDDYRKLADAGDSEAYDKTIGAVGPVAGAQLLPVVRGMYPGRFTEEELQTLGGLRMPAMKDVMRENMSASARAKDEARSAFWQDYRENTPPGSASYKMRDIPLIAAALDQSSRQSLTTEQYKLAHAMMRGWVAETYGGQVDPQVRAEWQQARAERGQLDTFISSQLGRESLGLLAAYDAAPNAQMKEQVRKQYPSVNQALALRLAFAKQHPVYASYYKSAAKGGYTRRRRR